ncbi:MAG: aspartate kinase [Marinilabiliales bacterium]|nr:MAG: aspartate kinase [Marinilabiliales bacterium]
MIVYKFGGASVRSAGAIRNLAGIVSGREGRLLLVISAFGKMTNALESLLESWYSGSGDRYAMFRQIRDYHEEIISSLFGKESGSVKNDFNTLAAEVGAMLDGSPSGSYDYDYDRMVSFGELASTRIVSSYLESRGIGTFWADARQWLVTDNTHREANVDFTLSGKRLSKVLTQAGDRIVVTQGFIGGTKDGAATTLGREGSDYTAAIAANLLEAPCVTVWKDVAGILTADPLYYPGAEKLDEISYHEAIELSFYGAKVIHPKTIKPLQNKNIPLYVKSFDDPGGSGTLIHGNAGAAGLRPVLIVKKEQMLVSLAPRDFSFVVEDCLSRIFAGFFRYRMKVNLIQHSAISFTICMDNGGPFVSRLLDDLRGDFRVLYNSGLELITIRHYTQASINEHVSGRDVIVEQRSRSTVQFVVARPAGN